ncbi:MAG TPA: helix-hairpin-helix domain-containing protein [Acidobacteriota bacterium]|nr:helix-hairpin-helix domain-containing protein [Acidobacteriota bacterium]
MPIYWHRTTCLFFIAVLLLTVLPSLAEADDAKVDLNTAGSVELQRLPGIGPALAKRIIQHREENGPFKRVEDLMNVPGIGEKKFESLKDKIVVAPASKDKPEKPSGGNR